MSWGFDNSVIKVRGWTKVGSFFITFIQSLFFVQIKKGKKIYHESKIMGFDKSVPFTD